MKSQWIKCSERMPEMDAFVLVYYGIVDCGYFDGVKWVLGDDDDLPTHCVTHWQPLPDAPKDGE